MSLSWYRSGAERPARPVRLARPRFLAKLLALYWKDLLTEYRTREVVNASLVFALMAWSSSISPSTCVTSRR